MVQSSTQEEEDWWLFWCALNCMTCQEISLFVQCREQIWQDINKQQPYDFYLSTVVYDQNHLFGLGSDTETETKNWPKLSADTETNRNHKNLQLESII